LRSYSRFGFQPSVCETIRFDVKAMVREFSAGGVVLRKMRGRWFMAVIEPHMERPKKPTSTTASVKAAARVVALPKGAIDKDEKPEQTALREISEETGVKAELIGKLADIKYFYVRKWGDHARVFKIVSFYLFLYRSGRLDNISREMRIEVHKAYWLPLDEAPKTLSYQGEREVVGRAQEYVKLHPELGSHATNTTH
jgi:8-oxo-dGTP pyrophosphatase MutT (NUDIX family)